MFVIEPIQRQYEYRLAHLCLTALSVTTPALFEHSPLPALSAPTFAPLSQHPPLPRSLSTHLCPALSAPTFAPLSISTPTFAPLAQLIFFFLLQICLKPFDGVVELLRQLHKLALVCNTTSQ